MSFGIIVKKYDHFNRAMGIHIKSKRHYDYEMKSRGFISSEEGQRQADSYKKEMQWIPSKDLRFQIRAMKSAAGKDGKIVLARVPKVVEAMEKNGMTFDMDKINKHLKEAGAPQNAVQ